MSDSIFDIMIVLIPLAIFIGRVVVQARNKRNPQPAKKPPPIPVHFEDYEDEDEDNRRFSPSAGIKTVTVIDQKNRADTYNPPPLMDSAPKSTPLKKAISPSAEPAQGFLNLNHLSPMKQAVVLAEILGPPKGNE